MQVVDSLFFALGEETFWLLYLAYTALIVYVKVKKT